ncbi:MAG: hypothetical protein ACW97A_14430, partial [Candidatus Thorarchaeota archaeon]
WTDAPLVVIDSAFTSDADGRVNIGTTISVYFHCVWLENSSAVETGLLYVNSTPHSINESGWVTITDSSSIVIRRSWIVTGVSVDGVTDFQFAALTPAAIWDAIIIWKMEVTDNRINVGALAEILYDGQYIYDKASYDGTLALNDTNYRYTTVGRRGYTVISAYGDTYGISVIQLNNETSIIWDGLNIELSVDHNRVGLGIPVSIQISAAYAYDGAIFNGTLPLNDTVFVQSSVGMRVYTVREEFITGGNWSIRAVISNYELYVIWDALEVHWSDKDRFRCDLGASVEVRFKVRYSYDRIPYTDFNGTLTINGIEATFDSLNEYWYISVSHNEAGSFEYRVDDVGDQTTAVETLIIDDEFFVNAIFDSVYVWLAGVSGTDIADGSEKDVLAPGTFSALLGSEVTIYFQLRYESDGTYINDPNTIVFIKGEKATFNLDQNRWEHVFDGSVIDIVEYRIDSFQDQYGLTQVDHRNLVPEVEWTLAPLPPDVLYIMVGGIAGLAVVVFIARTRRRVTALEHALTPEELLSLGDVGITSELRGQIVNQLEWLRDLSEEIPYIGNDVLSVLNEELTRAKQMYVKAFELEPPTEPAGMQLKEMLLQRIDSILESIEEETRNRL